MALVTHFMYIVIITLASIHSIACWNISLTPPCIHDDAETNCSSTGSSILIPLRVLQNITVSVVIETLDINETAWIGGEYYNIGCENETEIKHDRLCRYVVHERISVNSSLDYSCVQGTIDVIVVKNSTKPKSFAESSTDCTELNSRLPDINVTYPLYRLPSEIRMSDSGPQWFGTLDDALKDSLIRRCRIVTKIDECSLRIEFGDCDNTRRRGICIRDTGTQFHSALDFNIFRESSIQNSSQTDLITESSLCYVTTETATTETIPDDTTETATTEIVPDLSSTTDEAETTADVTTKTETDQSTRAEDTKTTQQTVAPPKTKGVESASSNLWVIAVVLIVLLVVGILVAIVIRKQRMSRDMSPGNEKRNHTSMYEATASVVGNYENCHWSATKPSGTNSGMEVERLDAVNVEIIELDNECKNTQRTDCEAIQRISVKSENENGHVMPYEIKCNMDKVQEETRTSSSENSQDTLNDEKSGLMVVEDVPLENTATKATEQD